MANFHAPLIQVSLPDYFESEKKNGSKGHSFPYGAFIFDASGKPTS
jgi:hypothetical protein